MQAHARVEPAIEHIGQQVDDDEDKGREQHGAHHEGEIEFVKRLDRKAAHALPAEDILHEEGACQQLGQPARYGRDNGIERVGQRMAVYDFGGREALGIGRADIVLREHIEQGAAGKLGNDGQGAYAQSEGGQYEVLNGEVPPGEGIVLPEAAGHIEAGEAVQQVAEDIGNEQARKEGGHGDACHAGRNGRCIEPGIFFERSQHAEGYAQYGGQGHGGKGEDDGAGQGLGQYGIDAAPGIVRAAEVRPFQSDAFMGAEGQQLQVAVFLLRSAVAVVEAEGQQVVEVEQVAGRERLVEVQLMAHVLQRGDIAALAYGEARRVARQHIEQEEHQRHQAPEHQQAIAYAPCQEPQHATSSSVCHCSSRCS